MGWFANGDRPSTQTLVRREAVVHLQDGETSIRGFVMDFYEDSIRLVKPELLQADENVAELAGELVIFKDQIKFVQILGGS